MRKWYDFPNNSIGKNTVQGTAQYMHSSINVLNPQYETVLTVIELTRGNTTYWSSVGHNGVECSGVKYSSEQRYKPVMSLVKRWGQRWPHQGDPIKVTLEFVLCCVQLCYDLLCSDLFSSVEWLDLTNMFHRLTDSY